MYTQEFIGSFILVRVFIVDTAQFENFRWVLRLAYFIAIEKYTFVLKVKWDFLSSGSKQYIFSFTNIYRHFVGTEPVSYFLNFEVNPIYQGG